MSNEWRKRVVVLLVDRRGGIANFHYLLDVVEKKGEGAQPVIPERESCNSQGNAKDVV